MITNWMSVPFTKEQCEQAIETITEATMMLVFNVRMVF